MKPGHQPDPSRAGNHDEEATRQGAPTKPEAQQMDVLAKVLDDLITVPGTEFGIGLDGLIGLIPGVGDSVTTTLAGTILVDAARRRVPIPVLTKMALNLIVDTALGYVPLVGDAADFAHRANRKNYRLLKQAIDAGDRVDDSYPAYMVRAVAVIVGVLVLMIASAVFMLWATITILVNLF